MSAFQTDNNDLIEQPQLTEEEFPPEGERQRAPESEKAPVQDYVKPENPESTGTSPVPKKKEETQRKYLLAGALALGAFFLLQ